METKSDIPSAARLSRIESILTGEPAFKGHIGKKTETVAKRDGSKAHYALEVVKVGQSIQSDGKDAVTLGKKEILVYATRVLLNGASANPVEAGAPAPAQVEGEGDEPAPGPTSAAPAVESLAGKSTDELRAAVNQNISILSLLVSADQLAPFDSRPGADSRRKVLADLTKQYAAVAQ